MCCCQELWKSPGVSSMPCLQSSGAVYGLLIALGGHVVALEYGPSAKRLPPLDGSDVLVLDNFVTCNTAIR
jgi:hypothetical protein